MGRTGIRPFLPTVHWDGMDTGTYTWRMGQYGTYWDPSIPSHGTLGWDGHRDIYPENGTVWDVLGSVHSLMVLLGSDCFCDGRSVALHVVTACCNKAFICFMYGNTPVFCGVTCC